MKTLLVASRIIRDGEDSFVSYDRYIHLKDVIEITKPIKALTAGEPKWYVAVRTRDDTYYLGVYDDESAASEEIVRVIRMWSEI
jgi:hypothetical protein